MALLVGALLIAPAAASAQSGYWWVGAGALVPTGDYGDVAKTGYLGTAGVGLNISSMPGVSINGEFLYGSNSAKAPATGSVSQTGGLINLQYEFSPAAEWNPYVYGGYGIVSAKASGGGSSESHGAWQISGGVSYKASPKLNVWGEVRYMSISTDVKATTQMPIVVGISMPFGK